MAYDFGANTLGIKNPFKAEGLAKLLTGIAICALGVFSLLKVSGNLKTDMVLAWESAILGLLLLTWGLRHMGIGLFQLFKFFVGRSVPTSLAYNKNTSEKDNARAERNQTAYDSDDIESMLMGRKNITFEEPQGWLSRLIHSLFPKLVFMPYPIRNFVQALAGLVIASLVAVVIYGIAYFVSNSGLAGKAGVLITPVLSIILLISMTLIWRSAAKSLSLSKNRKLQAKGASNLAMLVVIAIVIPALAGYLLSQVSPKVTAKIQNVFDHVFVFDAWFNLGLLFAVSLGIIAASWVMIRERFNMAKPTTDVSEFRENMQESIHPNEIFINIENIVLANRRYKEIPNRVYQEFTPTLEEQSQGKGSFKGQLLIETQPEVHEMAYSKLFKIFRLVSTCVSQLLILASAVLLTYVVTSAHELYVFAADIMEIKGRVSERQIFELLGQFGVLMSACLTLFFSWLTVSAGGKILAEGTRLFWSEMQFNSLLMWMKTEGTFTESKISTGMSIHDSTRSENVVVRSSITPWIITSRVVTSTFATSGTKNLEMPRYIMEMEKNTDEMNGIVNEIKSFFREREAIASITNEKDLSNTETIYQVNQVSRANMADLPGGTEQIHLEEQAAGKLLQEQEATE